MVRDLWNVTVRASVRIDNVAECHSELYSLLQSANLCVEGNTISDE